MREIKLGQAPAQRPVKEATWGGYASTDFRLVPAERLVQVVVRQEVPFDKALAKDLAASVHSCWPPLSAP
ncbi:MAG: hypothetical protein ACKVYV_13220 [Limisphaerales bacterium]